MSDHIHISDEAAVKIIRFNRIDKKNAITAAMYKAMADAITAAQAADFAAIVFLGQPGVFSAGNDIMDFMTHAFASDLTASPTVQFLKALATNKKPMIAGVDGLAIGVGTTMLMHCDIVYASARATFKTPFLSLGLVPEAGSSLIAPRLMGHQRAFELLVLGETFNAQDAQAAGLVNHITEEAEVEACAIKTAHRLAALPPEALALSRRLLRHDEAEILARIDEETALFAKRLHSTEAREAFSAFIEKRAPDFKKLIP